jgi:hypothetical protein
MRSLSLLFLLLVACGGSPYESSPVPTVPDSVILEPSPEAASPLPEAGDLGGDGGSEAAKPSEASPPSPPCHCHVKASPELAVGNLAQDCPGLTSTPGQSAIEYACIGCFGPDGLSCYVAPGDYPADISLEKGYCCH